MQCFSEDFIKKVKDPKIRKIAAIFAFVVAAGIVIYDLLIHPRLSD